ncbi:hypothetical protein ACW2QC_00645 [Virgibacillus sp. FSP13]
MTTAQVRKHSAVRSIKRHRDQINAIKNRQTASVLDMNEFQKQHSSKTPKLDEEGNIVLDPHKKDDCLWMDDE